MFKQRVCCIGRCDGLVKSWSSIGIHNGPPKVHQNKWRASCLLLLQKAHACFAQAVLLVHTAVVTRRGCGHCSGLEQAAAAGGGWSKVGGDDARAPTALPVLIVAAGKDAAVW